ncbi:MAG: alpha/beta hydrolase, partial [Candidatus Binataceae bacterium]
WATLRFNFRGVGDSEGEHSGGSGEAADAAAAVKFLTSRQDVQPQTAVLAGYSFGAMAAALAAPEISQLGALVLVALPLRMGNGAAALKNFNQPIVFAAGDHDLYCAASQLEALHQDLAPRSQLRIIAGADHFFGGYEEELASALAVMMRAL